MKRAFAIALLGACASRGGAATTEAPAVSDAPAAAVDPATPMRDIDTRVVTLAPGQPAAVMLGPFLVTTINPGGDLALSISPSGHCDDGVWFSYSGGGVAVPPDETLCARAGERGTHGFSGHR